MKLINPDHIEITHACLFAGAGGLSLGLNNGHARIGRAKATMRCLGGIDAWDLATQSFTAITNSRGIKMDLFDHQDYVAFHGKEPPPGWREATPADVREAFGECPDILASSPPCKGLSSLQTTERAESDKYQALNRLVVRGLELALQAFADDPPSLILLENVPRIQTRGRELLDVLKALLRSHGYAVFGTPHDCGEIGGLSQHRDRYLLVARHTRKVRPFLYQPVKRRVKSIAECIGEMALPDDPALGPMHRLPRLTWMTWLRLALIPAGKDWRALFDYAVEDGYLRDLGIAPVGAEWQRDCLGVRSMDDPSGAVTGRSTATNGRFSIADPRVKPSGSYQPYGVVSMDQPSRTVTAQSLPGSGPYSISDPRLKCDVNDKQGRRHNNVYRLAEWDKFSPAVTCGGGPASGGLSVADPRIGSLGEHSGKMAVQNFDKPSRTVGAGDSRVGSGAQCIADPRYPQSDRHGSNIAMQRWEGPARTITGSTDVQTGAQLVADPRFMHSKARAGDWSGGGQYGVAQWNEPSKTVAAKAKVDTGYWSVADPRGLPPANMRLDPPPLIISTDGTWHRPLTTLELAMLQGYPLHLWDGSLLQFAGTSDGSWREQCGNSVPPPTAQAIGDLMAETLLLEFLGHSFTLSERPIWVQPFAAAVSVAEMWEGA